MTKTRFTLGMLTLGVLALGGCGEGGKTTTPARVEAKATPAPQGGDWATTVAATPDGGFLLGNPAAPIKVIEYGSLTCGHCASFSATGMEPLKANYIATGKVSLEFRSFLLNGQDVMATALVECGGPTPFFGLLEATYAAQSDWLGKLSATPQAEFARLQALPVDQQNVAVAQMTGLDQFVIQRGVPADAARACLTNKATPERLLKARDAATTKYKITGTPTFILNGETLANTADWKSLEAALKAAGA